MLTPEAADVVNRGHDKDVAAVKAAPKSIDFMNDDAPLTTNFTLAGHESSVNVYGVLDDGVAHATNSLPSNNALPNNFYPWQHAISTTTANIGGQTAAISGGLQNSRIGVNASFNLVGSTNVVFTCETGFSGIDGQLTNAAKSIAQQSGSAHPDAINADSSINGGLCNRQAFAGLSNDTLGKIVFGFVNSPEKDIIGSFDPVKSDTFSPLGESGKIGGGGGVSPDARLNNAFKYTNKYDTGTGVVNVVGAYQIGNDLGNTSQGYAWSAGLGYTNKDWWNLSVQAAYAYYEDTYAAGVGATYNTLALTEQNVHTYVVAAKIQPLEHLKLSAGYEWYSDSAPTDNYTDAGYDTNAWGYAAKISTATSTTNNSIFFVGGEYDFAGLNPMLNGLKLQVGLYDTDIAKNLAATKEYNIYSESAVLDYRFNKRFDVYAAYTNNKFVANNNTSLANDYTNFLAYGVGARLTF